MSGATVTINEKRTNRNAGMMSCYWLGFAKKKERKRNSQSPSLSSISKENYESKRKQRLLAS
jgi:hypothetical protein